MKSSGRAVNQEHISNKRERARQLKMTSAVAAAFEAGTELPITTGAVRVIRSAWRVAAHWSGYRRESRNVSLGECGAVRLPRAEESGTKNCQPNTKDRR